MPTPRSLPDGTITLKSASSSGSSAPDGAVRAIVADVIADIRENGDEAVRRYSEKFDRWTPESFLLSPSEIEEAMSRVPKQTIDDIVFVQKQVRTMAQRQRDSLEDFEIETFPGVKLGQRNIPITSSGAYVPGGRYPLLASAHMTIVTAKVAGVERVSAATPPIGGVLPDATIAAMHLAGADEIRVLGGVQAVTALSLGTESIDRVDLIAGPGNAFVAEAKRQLFGEVGIDLFAGPTEVLIVADDAADPLTVAVDLLSQAEHGPDSPAVLITTSPSLAERVDELIEQLLPGMPTKDFAEPAWRDHGQIHVVDSLKTAYALADDFAFEHVQILTREPREALTAMRHYGALFLGDGTCVSYGDKTIGTNHVLPTRGAARYTGGLWVGKYLRTVTYQEVTDAGSSAMLGEVTGRAARAESFEGHARSGDLRVARFGGGHFDWIPESALTVG
jgi:sulfopropanediol 3-dehydrogenase